MYIYQKAIQCGVKELVKQYMESEEKSFDSFISEDVISTNFSSDVVPENKLDMEKEEIEEI